MRSGSSLVHIKRMGSWDCSTSSRTCCERECQISPSQDHSRVDTSLTTTPGPGGGSGVGGVSPGPSIGGLALQKWWRGWGGGRRRGQSSAGCGVGCVVCQRHLRMGEKIGRAGVEQRGDEGGQPARRLGPAPSGRPQAIGVPCKVGRRKGTGAGRALRYQHPDQTAPLHAHVPNKKRRQTMS